MSGQKVQILFDGVWRWLLVPTQPVASSDVASLQWEVAQTTGNSDSIVARASRRMRASEHLITKWLPALLKMELDRWFWKGQDHVLVKTVWDALSACCYLPRLRDQEVLAEDIRDGIASVDYFGYATSISGNGRYEGLKFGEAALAVWITLKLSLPCPTCARMR